jgi:hypothetical protein
VHFGLHHQGLVAFPVYPPDDLVVIVKIQWLGQSGWAPRSQVRASAMSYGDHGKCRGKGAAVIGGWHARQCW